MNQNQNQVVQSAANSVSSQKFEIWTLAGYASYYHGIRIVQKSENRTGFVVTDIERGKTIVDLLDIEERSKGYILKTEEYPRTIVYQSAKATSEIISFDGIKTVIDRLMTAKIASLNALQNIYPVEIACGGAQLFIEKLPITIQHLNTYSANMTNFVTCFYFDPENPGVKRAIQIRYYRTGTGKCQYAYFTASLSSIFTPTIASRIADPRKILKACIAKYNEVLALLENNIKLTDAEKLEINSQLGSGTVQ